MSARGSLSTFPPIFWELWLCYLLVSLAIKWEISKQVALMELNKILGHCRVSLPLTAHRWHIGSCLQKGLNKKGWKQLTRPSPWWQSIVCKACAILLMFTNSPSRGPPKSDLLTPTLSLPLLLSLFWQGDHHLLAQRGGAIIWFFIFFVA